MATVLKLKLSPEDHGRPITNEELTASEFEGGYKYEVIEGRLYVTLEPELAENFNEEWLKDKLKLYASLHLAVINYVSSKARIFVPGRRGETIPEPDLAAYRDFPLHLPLRNVRWEDISPLLVGEILSRGNPDKDLVRNVALYLRVPTIREYWVLDTRDDPDRPTLYVYRRRGQRWQNVIEVPYGETYTTRLLPGFRLLVDPRR
jgi:Uma2 family endonuclease